MKKQLLLMLAMSLQFASFAQYESVKNKNRPNGYAGLNAQGKIDTSRLPKVNVAASWNSITGKPTTLSGYGITDALTKNSNVNWNNVVSRPTTLSGYGITDALTANSDLNFYRITNRPNTLMAYGISDGLSTSSSLNWNNVVNRPTTLSGYGITDGGVTAPATNWITYTSPMGTTNNFDLAYGNGVFVATGWNSLNWSTDGVRWVAATNLPTGMNTGQVKVNFSNGVFVLYGVVGNGIWTSADGRNWTQRMASGGVNNIVGCAYTNGIWVAMAAVTHYTSTDNGVTWTSRSNTLGPGAICAANGLFVVGCQGTSNLIFTSNDGINFTNTNFTSASFINIRAITYGNGVFVFLSIVSDQNQMIVTSTNLVNFTPANFSYGVSATNNSIVYGNNQYLGVINANSTSYLFRGSLSASSNVPTWSQVRTFNSLGIANKICYGDGVYLILTTNGNIFRSGSNIENFFY
jgi:hypothetical protein